MGIFLVLNDYSLIIFQSVFNADTELHLTEVL